MKKIALNILFIAFLLLVPNSKAISATYYLLVSSMQFGLNDNNYIRIGGGSWKGSALICVNDNPIEMMEFGGALIDITPWIKKGENTVAFSGNSKAKIYTKIISKLNPKTGNHKIWAAESFILNGNADVKIRTNIPYDYTPIYFKSKIPKNTQIEKDRIINKVIQLKKLLLKRKKDMVVERLSQGAQIFYGEQDLDYKFTQKKAAIRRSLSFNIKKISFEKENVKIIWGSQSAYVYSGFEHHEFTNHNEPYLYEMITSDGEKQYFPPLRFVYLNDSWIIWN